jgi:hypothetical protein
MKEEFFPYRKLSHHTFGKIKIPSVELTLKATREVKLYAIVDSARADTKGHSWIWAVTAIMLPAVGIL